MAATNTATQRALSTSSQSVESGGVVRCSVCLIKEVESVCAACGRFLCVNCSYPSSSLTLRTNDTVQSRTSEASHGSVFCKEHWPRGLSPSAVAIVSLVVFVVFSLFVLPASPFLWLLSIGLAIALKTSQRKIDWWLLGKRRIRNLDTLAIFPHYEFEFNEAILVDFYLGIESSPYLDIGDLSGSVTMKLIVDEDENAARIKLAYIRLLHAGFAHLSGRDAITFESSGSLKAPGNSATSLVGSLPSDFDIALQCQQVIGKTWKYGNSVATASGETNWTVPFHISPNSAAPILNTHLWGLEFTIDDSVTRVVIREVRVSIPPELESVSYTDGIVERDLAQIVWRDLIVTSGSGASILVEFVQPIHQAKSIHGRYNIEIENDTRTGVRIESGRVWRATGRPVAPKYISTKSVTSFSGDINVETRLQAKFEEVITRRRHIVTSGIAMDLNIAHTLIQHLADDDLYLKDISASHEEGSVESHYWEIMGRRYVNDQPYDVHIVLAGSYAGQNGDDTGTTFEVIVRTLSQLQFVVKEKQNVEALADDLVTSMLEAYKVQ